MLTIREAVTDTDLEAWRQVRLAVLPYERAATVEEMRASLAEEPDRRMLIVELGGEVAGSGLVGTSSLGCAGVHPRVLPGFRRRGIGTALYDALATLARAAGHVEGVGYVDDEGSFAFATGLGYREVDRQVEQVRAVTRGEPWPPARDDVELVTVAQRPELLEAAYPLAVEGYADFATPRPVSVTREDWLRSEATLPEGSFVALAGEEIVGYCGLCRDPDDPGRAEDGLTVVRRDWRRRGLALHLKQAELAWAAANGIRLVYTWTQRGNEGMRAVNEKLGYLQRHVSVTMLGDL